MRRFFEIIKKTFQEFSYFKKIFFVFFLVSFILGLVFLFEIFLNRITILAPKTGGSLKLGLICRPSFINPVLLSSNDCDRDLTELIYDSLFSIDGKGELVPRLAKKIEISPDGKIYTVFLKDNIFWHDGVPFTSEDVVFTIETVQNPKIKSPLRLNWEGIVAEALNKSVVRFNLRSPYQPFLQSLTLKILPKHIWYNIEPENFALAEYNLKPVGLGPYLFESLEREKKGKIISYSLISNRDYYLGTPKINNLTFYFYDSYEKAKEAFLRKEIEGFSPVELEDLNFFLNKKGVSLKNLILPGYYAIFYNLENKIFTPNIREALELAIDKNLVEKDILKNQASVLDSILLPPFLKNLKTKKEFSFSLEKAQEILKKEGYSKANPLKFKLYVPNIKEFIEVVNFITNSWQKIGVEAEITILEPQELIKEVIETRSYEALFFGEIIGTSADLFPFWHSSQINVPGLNLSFYKNKNLDQLIEENRLISDETKKMENFNKIKEIIQKDKPALFLYNTYYLYLIPSKIKGHQIQIANFPSERFSDIYNWYIFTLRKLK